MTDTKVTDTATANKGPQSTESAPVVPKKIERNRPRRKGGKRNDRKKEPKEFEESILRISRVTRVVKGGRRMRFQVTVIIGDKKGRVGMGVGKSGEVLGGIQKAIAEAKKNLVRISIENGTILHEVSAKFKASKVFLLPAPEGKGLIAGGAVRKILELAGVKDVLSKAHGSRNALNLARATFVALADLPTKTVAVKKVEEKKDESKEEKKPVAKKEVAVTAEKKAPVKKTAAKADDLTKIEGIGPKISSTLISAGVITFADLAKTKSDKISEIIADIKGNHVTGTWPKQAKLAADGKWDELKTWQDELDGGK